MALHQLSLLKRTFASLHLSFMLLATKPLWQRWHMREGGREKSLSMIPSCRRSGYPSKKLSFTSGEIITTVEAEKPECGIEIWNRATLSTLSGSPLSAVSRGKDAGVWSTSTPNHEAKLDEIKEMAEPLSGKIGKAKWPLLCWISTVKRGVTFRCTSKLLWKSSSLSFVGRTYIDELAGVEPATATLCTVTEEQARQAWPCFPATSTH